MCTTPTLSMMMLEQSIYLAGSCEKSGLDGIRIVRKSMHVRGVGGEVKVKKNK